MRTEGHVKKWGFTKRNSDDGIIGVVSADRSTVLTTSWEPTQHLQANQRRTFSCIHANPYKSQSVALKDDVILTITGAQGLPLKAIRWELVKD